MVAAAALVLLKLVLIFLSVLGIVIWLFWLVPAEAAFRNGMPGSGLRLLSVASFGALLLFCIFSCVGILGWRKLLFAGAAVQFAFLLVVIVQLNQHTEIGELMGEVMVRYAFYHLGLWWLHFLAQYLYQTRFEPANLA